VNTLTNIFSQWQWEALISQKSSRQTVTLTDI